MKRAIALGIPGRSVRRILHLDLYFHPYKMMVVQELHRDWSNHIAFAQNVLEIVADDMAINMSDEARFHLSGCVNKHHFYYWSGANPRQLHEHPLHSECVTVWCCVEALV
jgi:hypothetical protein